MTAWTAPGIVMGRPGADIASQRPPEEQVFKTMGYNSKRNLKDRISEFAAARDGKVVVTGSHWRMWWLTRFRGHTVKHVIHQPKIGAFGRIRYDSVWVLVPPGVE
ncbi:MAG: hypothetical protein HY706_11000 [Candidatus Hydrogenedentes bacterium]|nr:hypothetical protein [Candidatus Hydrogenedentota bacterium]